MTTQPKVFKDWRITSCYCLLCHTPLGRWVGDEVPFPEEHPMVHLCRTCAADAKREERMGGTVFIRYLKMPVEIIVGKKRGRGRPPAGAPSDPFKDPGLTRVTSMMLGAEQYERDRYGSKEDVDIRGVPRKGEKGS